MPQGTSLKQFNKISGPDRKRTKTALSKMMRRSYLTTNQKLLETVKITEPF